MYLLDTNICIYIINHKPEKVFKKFEKLSSEIIGISVITLAELSFGVQKSLNKEKNQKALQLFLSPLSLFNFDENAAFIYSELRFDLQKKGKLIGPMDLLIAGHALSLNATLVTNNVKEFSRVKNLATENWA